MDKSMKINCLIADDEPLARLVIERYIALMPHLHLIKSCQNAFEVLEILRVQKIDIVFLDIKMPEFTGLQLLKTLETKPAVILTTAFSEFAVDAFELGVVDYLMKPIAFERFVKAINRAINDPTLTQSLPTNNASNSETQTDKHTDFLFFKADKTFHKVLLNDIICIEAYGNFIKVKTSKNTLVVADKISTVEQQLDNQLFMRVHKSYIVAINHIESVTGNTIHTIEGSVPIGESYRTFFFEWLSKR
jgi:DNA-binding LytR/AlgR family response regulator